MRSAVSTLFLRPRRSSSSADNANPSGGHEEISTTNHMSPGGNATSQIPPSNHTPPSGSGSIHSHVRPQELVDSKQHFAGLVTAPVNPSMHAQGKTPATHHELTKAEKIKHWKEESGLNFLSQYGFTSPMIEKAYEQFQHDPQTLIHNIVEHGNNKESFLKMNERLLGMENAKTEHEHAFAFFMKRFNNDYPHQIDARNNILRRGLEIEEHIPYMPKFFERYKHKLHSHNEGGNHGSANYQSRKPTLLPKQSAENEELHWLQQFNPLHHLENIQKAFQPKTTNANWNTVNAQGLYIASH